MALCAGCSRTFPPEHPISSQGVRQSHFPANAPHQADAALVLQHVCAAQDEVGMALADLAAARARAIDWLVHVANVVMGMALEWPATAHAKSPEQNCSKVRRPKGHTQRLNHEMLCLIGGSASVEPQRIGRRGGLEEA